MRLENGERPFGFGMWANCIPLDKTHFRKRYTVTDQVTGVKQCLASEHQELYVVPGLCTRFQEMSDAGQIRQTQVSMEIHIDVN